MMWHLFVLLCVLALPVAAQDIPGTPGTPAGTGAIGDIVFGAPPAPTPDVDDVIQVEDCAEDFTFPTGSDAGRTYIHQTADPVTNENRGRIHCDFTVSSAQAGQYRVYADVYEPSSAGACAADNSCDSFYFTIDENVDLESPGPDQIGKYFLDGAVDQWVSDDPVSEGSHTGGGVEDPKIWPLTEGSHTVYIWAREPLARIDNFRFEEVVSAGGDQEYSCTGTNDADDIQSAYNLLTSGQTLAIDGDCDLQSGLAFATGNTTVHGNNGTWTYSGNYGDDEVVHVTAEVNLQNVTIDGNDEACNGIAIDESADNGSLADVTVHSLWQNALTGVGSCQVTSSSYRVNGIKMRGPSSGWTFDRVTIRDVRNVYWGSSKPQPSPVRAARGLIVERSSAGYPTDFTFNDLVISDVYSSNDGDCMRFVSDPGGNLADGVLHEDMGGVINRLELTNCSERFIKTEASGLTFNDVTLNETFVEDHYTQSHTGPGEVCTNDKCWNNGTTGEGSLGWQIRSATNITVNNLTATVSSWHWVIVGVDADTGTINYNNFVVSFKEIPGCPGDCLPTARAFSVNPSLYRAIDFNLNGFVVYDNGTGMARDPGFVIDGGNTDVDSNWDLDDVCIESGVSVVHPGRHTGSLTSASRLSSGSYSSGDWSGWSGSWSPVASCP